MFLLPRRLRQLLEKLREAKESRIFLKDQEVISIVQKVARQQGRSEQEVISDLTKAGWDQLQARRDLEDRWNALSQREQEVAALICLGFRNYQIAAELTIAPDTVKAHLQNIFIKFNLHSSKELRFALRDWDFAEWWKSHRHE